MTPEKFWKKVHRRGKCWIFRGANTGKRKGWGHGRVMHNGKLIMATHYVLGLFGRKVPPGKVVAHTCDVPACVNPACLVITTQSDNVQQSYDRGRAKKEPVKGQRPPLTDDEKKSIRRAYLKAKGKGTRAPRGSVAKLAAEFNVSRSQIAKVVREQK